LLSDSSRRHFAFPVNLLKEKISAVFACEKDVKAAIENKARSESFTGFS